MGKDVTSPLSCSAFPTAIRSYALAGWQAALRVVFSPLRSIDSNRPIQNDRCKPSNNGLQRFCYHFWAVSELRRNDFTYFPYGAARGDVLVLDVGIALSEPHSRMEQAKARFTAAELPRHLAASILHHAFLWIDGRHFSGAFTSPQRPVTRQAGSPRRIQYS